jgi:shikimate 5-dehydrogenase
VNPDRTDARHLVADMVYTPLETEFVTSAKRKGARATGGGGMCQSNANLGGNNEDRHRYCLPE